MTGIALRPATSADSDFCYLLHKAAMGEYVTAVWGWDEEVQQEFHARAFDPCSWQIVTAGGEDIGMLAVEYRPDEVYLARIEIHPDHQGRGVGTELISMLLEEATRRGHDFALDVLVVDERARRLYERLGLTAAGIHGGGHKLAMRAGRRPSAGTPGDP